MDGLIVSLPSGGWLAGPEINASVRELVYGIRSLTVKQCLDRLIDEGIVKRRFCLWWAEYRYALKQLPEVTHLRHMLRTSVQHNVVLNYNLEIQLAYESAVIACLDAAAAEVVPDTVVTVYNRRLAERAKQGSF